MIKKASYYRHREVAFVDRGSVWQKKGASLSDLVEVIWVPDTFVSKRGRWVDDQAAVKAPCSDSSTQSQDLRGLLCLDHL